MASARARCGSAVEAVNIITGIDDSSGSFFNCSSTTQPSSPGSLKSREVDSQSHHCTRLRFHKEITIF